MVLLTCENIRKSYTEKPLITDVSISIHDTDKIGFVGVNGTGKSTLLKSWQGKWNRKAEKLQNPESCPWAIFRRIRPGMRI